MPIIFTSYSVFNSRVVMQYDTKVDSHSTMAHSHLFKPSHVPWPLSSLLVGVLSLNVRLISGPATRAKISNCGGIDNGNVDPHSCTSPCLCQKPRISVNIGEGNWTRCPSSNRLLAILHRMVGCQDLGIGRILLSVRFGSIPML